jgi:hypothetical protein
LSRATTPIHPATAIAALRKAFPRNGVVLVDSGAHRAFAGHYWTAYEPRTYISAMARSVVATGIDQRSAISFKRAAAASCSMPAPPRMAIRLFAAF